MLLFIDDETIRHFKLIVKQALNGVSSHQEIALLLQILFSCRTHTQTFYQTGLFSMVLELVNRNLSSDLVIDYLIRIDLSTTLINEIYQRGLFTRLVEVMGR